MSISRTTRGILTVAAAALLWGWGVAFAEVATSGKGPRGVSTILMDRVNRITDGADPIPQLRWNPYRRVNPVVLLNVSGAVRVDGRPDVAILPEVGWPFVTWAYNNGRDHDIAFSFWTGDKWSDTEFLTFDITDEIDPRVFVSPQHAISVIWAVNGADSRIMLTSRRVGDTTWIPPVRVTLPGEHVSRPSIASAHGQTWVAYERWRNIDGDPTPTVVVKRVGGDETGLAVRTFPSQKSKELDPVLHVIGDRVWMDWKFSDDQFAFVVLEGPSDHNIHMIPWADASWVGVESARLLIQRRVMGFEPATNADGTLSNTP